MAGATGIEFYEGFEWAVPIAFAAAVHACRFEQGDVLYSDASAYSGSKRAKRPARHHIQVLDPPRTTRALAGEGEGQRFFANWESPVRFEWRDYEKGESQEHTTTQGQLFTCLWKGDVSLLQASGDDGGDPCERPLLLRDLQSHVEAAAPTLAAKLGKKGASKHLFAVALDLSSDASLAKAHEIEAALASRGALRTVTSTPAELGIDDVIADRFHPALVVRGFATALSPVAQVEETLRDVLYAGSKSPEARKEGGRFQLNRHGCLLPL